MKKLIILLISLIISININAMYTDSYGNMHPSEPAAVNLSNSYHNNTSIEIGQNSLMNNQSYNVDKMKNKTDYHTSTIFDIGVIAFIIIFVTGFAFYVFYDDKKNNF